MNFILRQLESLADSDLYGLSEAIDLEMERRSAATDPDDDSARRRTNDRNQSYRRRTGSGAPPIRVVGIGKAPEKRRAA